MSRVRVTVSYGCPPVSVDASVDERQDAAVDETIGERLRRLRAARNLSQRQLSGPGVTAAYISRIEAGQRVPSVRALRVLAPKLGVSVGYLETGRDLTDAEDRDIRLGDAELRLRLGESDGDLDESLLQLLDEARSAGDLLGERRAQVALGLAAAQRSDHAEAVERLGQVVNTPNVTPLSHPDVFYALGHSYSELGQHAPAIRLFQDCLDQLGQSELASEPIYVRFATYLSYALADAGDLAGAQAAVEEAVAHAATIEDAYARVRLYWSRARLASIAGENASALADIRTAITLLEQTEDTLHLGLAYLLQGEFLLEAGRLDEAEATLELATRLIGGADAQHRAGLLAEQAKLAARRGHGQQAVELARQALALVGTQTPSEEGRARWALAEGLAAIGDQTGADEQFGRAERLLEREGRYTLQILKARARIARDAGRLGDAIALLERATEHAANPLKNPSPPGPVPPATSGASASL
jgi:transcriptional regulator with XRE-family HTH domain/Tfp pilus assembly protein PilF